MATVSFQIIRSLPKASAPSHRTPSRPVKVSTNVELFRLKTNLKYTMIPTVSKLMQSCTSYTINILVIGKVLINDYDHVSLEGDYTLSCNRLTIIFYNSKQ